MPMYTQRCADCKIDKVYVSSIAERDNQVCRECGKPLTRLLDVPGMVYAPTSSVGGTLK